MATSNPLQSMNPSAPLSIAVFLTITTMIHFLYEGLIRPSAAHIIATEGAAATTSFWVIIKDYEQQACLTLGLYCCFLMIYKAIRIVYEEPVYTWNHLADLSETENDLDTVLQQLENSQFRDSVGCRTRINCILRYKNTANVQHASDAITTTVDSLAHQLEAGNSLIRYFIWAIPSIGFVGTVRGIGAALAKAEEAIGGDIAGMVDKLGLAFNSTLVSLLISLLLMLLLHLLNNQQDLMVIKTQQSCEDHLLTHLHH